MCHYWDVHYSLLSVTIHSEAKAIISFVWKVLDYTKVIDVMLTSCLVTCGSVSQVCWDCSFDSAWWHQEERTSAGGHRFQSCGPGQGMRPSEILMFIYLFFLHCGNLIIIIPHYLIFRCLREHLVSMPKKPHVNLQGTFCACLCLRICWVRRKKETCWSHVIFFIMCTKTRSLLQVGSSTAQESQLIEDLWCWRRTT